MVTNKQIEYSLQILLRLRDEAVVCDARGKGCRHDDCEIDAGELAEAVNKHIELCEKWMACNGK